MLTSVDFRIYSVLKKTGALGIAYKKSATGIRGPQLKMRSVGYFEIRNHSSPMGKWILRRVVYYE